jgi:hypothetical protein
MPCNTGKEFLMNALLSRTDCEKSSQDIARELCGPVNTLKGAVFFLKTHGSAEQALCEMTVLMENEILRIEDLIVSLRHGPSYHAL